MGQLDSGTVGQLDSEIKRQWDVGQWERGVLLRTWEQGKLAMELLYDVHGQQGPDLLLHDLICKERHTDQIQPDTSMSPTQLVNTKHTQ